MTLSRFALSYGATTITLSGRQVMFRLGRAAAALVGRVDVVLDGREAGGFEGEQCACEVWASGWLQGLFASRAESLIRPRPLFCVQCATEIEMGATGLEFTAAGLCCSACVNLGC